MATALITGITGQDGAYLADLLLKKNYKVLGTTRKISSDGSTKLNYLNILNKVNLVEFDSFNLESISKLIETNQINEIYHLAGQSSVSKSFDSPFETLSFNFNSTLFYLESIRRLKHPIKFFQALSSDMFGNPDKLPVTKDSPLQPKSPYAVSKAACYHLIQDYRNSYNVFASSGILFSHESYLRPDHFFIKKVIKSAVAISKGHQKELRVGNINIKRDFGYAPAYMEAVWLSLQQSNPDDYIICSSRGYSLKEIIEHIFNRLNIPLD
ncbi:MAG: GDP-mannose 4,6-dehydratase, partial [Daejeonella sp.]